LAELFGESLRLGLHRKDGKLGTDNLAVVTIDAFALLGDHRRVVALAVEFVGKLEDILGTEFDAVAAAFTPVVDDAHRAPRDLDLLGIKRDSPKRHVIACGM